MNAVINVFVGVTFVLVTMTQMHQMSPGVGYSSAGVTGAIAFGFAIARYKQRKDRGE